MAVAGVQRLQIEMDAVEPGVQDLPRRCDDSASGRGPLQTKPVGPFGGELVAQPGLDPDAGQGAVYGVEQPPRPGVAGGGQGAVVFQRPGVDVQVLDTGPLDPGGERGEVCVVLAPVDPGVAEPDGVAATGAGAVARVT